MATGSLYRNFDIESINMQGAVRFDQDFSKVIEVGGRGKGLPGVRGKGAYRHAYVGDLTMIQQRQNRVVEQGQDGRHLWLRVPLVRCSALRLVSPQTDS